MESKTSKATGSLNRRGVRPEADSSSLASASLMIGMPSVVRDTQMSPSQLTKMPLKGGLVSGMSGPFQRQLPYCRWKNPRARRCRRLEEVEALRPESTDSVGFASASSVLCLWEKLNETRQLGCPGDQDSWMGLTGPGGLQGPEPFPREPEPAGPTLPAPGRRPRTGVPPPSTCPR